MGRFLKKLYLSEQHLCFGRDPKGSDSRDKTILCCIKSVRINDWWLQIEPLSLQNQHERKLLEYFDQKKLRMWADTRRSKSLSRKEKRKVSSSLLPFKWGANRYLWKGSWTSWFHDCRIIKSLHHKLVWRCRSNPFQKLVQTSDSYELQRWWRSCPCLASPHGSPCCWRLVEQVWGDHDADNQAYLVLGIWKARLRVASRLGGKLARVSHFSLKPSMVYHESAFYIHGKCRERKR